MSSTLGRAVGVFVALGLLAGATSHRHHGGVTLASAAGAAAGPAVGFAYAQLGKPYQWGGTGPGAFDCSGLAQQAWAAAGVTLPRTSQEQWAAGVHVPAPRPGDLVFFAGADGTPSSPGHVGIVIGRHRMIEAYAPGVPVRISHFGTPGSPPGDTTPAGFTDPAAGTA